MFGLDKGIVEEWEGSKAAPSHIVPKILKWSSMFYCFPGLLYSSLSQLGREQPKTDEKKQSQSYNIQNGPHTQSICTGSTKVQDWTSTQSDMSKRDCVRCRGKGSTQTRRLSSIKFLVVSKYSLVFWRTSDIVLAWRPHFTNSLGCIRNDLICLRFWGYGLTSWKQTAKDIFLWLSRTLGTLSIGS